MRFHEDDCLRRELLGRIPLAARVVLDVGCGEGALAADYRRLNPRARIFGIEYDRRAAAVAAPHLDGISRVSVVDEPLPFDIPEGVDCVLHRGVLEHLADPRDLLLTHAAVLNDDGTILICLPNPDYWRHQERALHGGGTAVEPGPGAVPRRLSIEVMAAYLGSVGLQLGAVYPVEADAVEAAAFVAAMTPALLALGIDPQAFAARSSPAYFVWCVRKSPLQLLTVAASMLAPVGGVSHVRIVEPLQAMATDPSVITYLSPGGDRDRIDAHSPRIFVLHRPALNGEEGLVAIRALQRDGWLIVTEFDDHPDFFEIMRGDGQFAFTGVHAVQTSTPVLASLLRLRNPEVAVFPNAIRALPASQNFASPDAMTMFFGALNREPDWAPLMSTLNSVASWAGGRLRFCVLHDRGFFDALETPHKVFTPVCDYEAYLQLLGGCEISLMPLLDTPFNRAKSDLKFIEAGACRVVPLASDIVYAGSIEDGVTGLLFRNADELRTRLLRLIAMPHMALDIADAARSHVAEHRMLAYQVAPRIRWYRSLWDRKLELTEALETRLRLAGVG